MTHTVDAYTETDPESMINGVLDLLALMKTLDPLARSVLTLAIEGYSLREIGVELGLTRMKVWRTLRSLASVHDLKDLLTPDPGPCRPLEDRLEGPWRIASRRVPYSWTPDHRIKRRIGPGSYLTRTLGGSDTGPQWDPKPDEPPEHSNVYAGESPRSARRRKRNLVSSLPPSKKGTT